MATERDDDALRWAGDDDPTLSPTQESPTQESPTGESLDRESRAGEPPGEDAAATSAVALLATGIIAGFYLLYVIGWFLGVSRIATPFAEPVAAFMFTLGGWLAVIAPLVWFGAVYWLTIDRARARFIWLLLGVIVLVPYPLVLGVGGVS